MPNWLSPSTDLTLLPHRVHIWRAALDQPAEVIQYLATFLADDERARAGRFHFERDRRRFTVGRGVLRLILSRYLKISPVEMQFGYGAQGKPFLAGQPDNGLQFNLSHSHELAVYAFTCRREIGIDLEYLRPLPDLEAIAGRFFAPQEIETLLKLPASRQVEGFFNCWTRKEAYIKAIGQGLTMPLDQFNVSLAPGQPAAMLNNYQNPGEVSRWSLTAFTPAPNYAAAVAVAGHNWQPTFFQWTPT
jgi:4'-phosphopantetheinyl transferase